MSCSDQYSVFTSVDDHLSYYDMYTGCGAVETNNYTSQPIVVYDNY